MSVEIIIYSFYCLFFIGEYDVGTFCAILGITLLKVPLYAALSNLKNTSPRFRVIQSLIEIAVGLLVLLMIGFYTVALYVETPTKLALALLNLNLIDVLWFIAKDLSQQPHQTREA